MFIVHLDGLKYYLDGKALQIRVENENKNQVLSPHIEIAAYSPIVMHWGYMGAAPKQTSLAITFDYLVRVEQRGYWPYHLSVSEIAIALHGNLLNDVISKLDMGMDHIITSETIFCSLEAGIVEMQMENTFRASRITTRDSAICENAKTSDLEWSW